MNPVSTIKQNKSSKEGERPNKIIEVKASAHAEKN